MMNEHERAALILDLRRRADLAQGNANIWANRGDRLESLACQRQSDSLREQAALLERRQP